MKPFFAWVFPGGKKIIAKDTGVAGNVATTKTVPAGKTWLVINAKVDLTTNGTVVNRYARITAQDIANVAKMVNVGQAQAQSLGPIAYFFIYGLTTTAALYNALGYILLTPGEDFVFSIDDGQAGDAYDYVLEYLEIDTP